MTKFRWLVVLAVLTPIVLWWQAQQSAWNSHAQVDIWILWQRLNYWYVHQHSFAGLSGNEVLPATLLYLFVPVWLAPMSSVLYAVFLPIMMILAALILGVHWFFMENKIIFLTTLLFFGPLLLFRFDMLVTLFTLLSLYAFTRERMRWSGIWLGLATGMKVFPVILLPYLCLLLIKQRKIKSLLSFVIFFVEALLVPVFIFLLLGGSLTQVNEALAFHSHKLISIESVPGSFITGWSLLTEHMPPTLIPGNGIWAVPGPAVFFNRLWVIPIALLFWRIWRSHALSHHFSYQVPFALMLVFSVFSKNLNPQYLWWFLVFLPLIKPSRMLWILALLVALLNQLVFPLYYTTFVDSFFAQNEEYWIYYLLLLRNIGVIAMTWIAVRQLFSHSHREESQA